MWMMGCSDGGEFNIPESFNVRKLRSLMPRTTMASSTNSSNTSRVHGNEFFSLNHHLGAFAANMADQSKRDFHTQQVVVSSRWNPTPEQLRTLEELYRRGTRTPSTEQIQHITAQLRRYGKIEGKNVFYWFQNHKARERQKRRRQMESAVPDQEHHQQQQESEANRTGNEGEQIKNWAPSTNCSTLPEESNSMQRGAKGAMAECRQTDGWIQLDEMEFQHRRNIMERNGTWQMKMQLSCPYSTHHFIMNNPTSSPPPPPPTTASTTSTPTTQPLTTTTPSPTIRTMDPKLIKANISIAPYYRENEHLINEQDNGSCGDSQTLQLFPLRSCGSDVDDSINGKETETSSVTAAEAAVMNGNFTTPCQFFEFLPLKN